VLLTPTVIVAAPPATPENTNAALGGTLLHNTYPFNLCGFPALSVPCGFSPDGLPIGLQIIGRPDDEAAVLRLGHAYEEATPLKRPRPGTTCARRSGTHHGEGCSRHASSTRRLSRRM